jgi:hypothetical protein
VAHRSRDGEITFLPVDDDHIDLDDTELVWIEPLPSWVWYRDMADFAAGIGDEQAARRPRRAIQGRGAFGRFRSSCTRSTPTC